MSKYIHIETSPGIPHVIKTTAPVGTDNGYAIPTLWFDSTGKKIYCCVAVAAGVATWVDLGVIAASDLATDTTNFDGILTAADNTVQKALDTTDDETGIIKDKLGGDGDVITDCGGLQSYANSEDGLVFKNNLGTTIAAIDMSLLTARTGTFKILPYAGTLAHLAYIDIATRYGFGFAVFDSGTDFAMFVFRADGTSDLWSFSGNVDPAATDGKYCIYQSGTSVRIQNRMGSSKNILLFYLAI